LTCEIETLKTFFPLEAPKNLFAEEVLLVTSTNDPYMSTEEALSLQETLRVEMKVIEDAGHINTSSGFGEWPWVKEWVMR
jgi:predicted alpha/beta hydrolase family esterase